MRIFTSQEISKLESCGGLVLIVLLPTLPVESTCYVEETVGPFDKKVEIARPQRQT